MTDIIDLGRIQETSDGDVEFEQELIEMYLEDAEEHCSAIIENHSAGDSQAIRQAAHTLKGSSANIGASHIMKVAYDIEVSATRGELEAVSSLIPAMKDSLTKTQSAFKAYLKELE